MLKSLQIHALRGATRPLTLTFDGDKKIAILYGENGTGKSTICDAIELVTNEAVGSLDNKGIGRTTSYWHSTGYQPNDLGVTLATKSGVWQARIVKSKVVITPDQGRPRAAILRRSQILSLVASPPKSRFDAVRPFLDIESVESSEATLRNLIDQEKKGRETAVARIDENLGTIDSFWREAGAPAPGALMWARREITADTSVLQAQVAALDETLKTINKLTVEEANRSQLAGEISQLEIMQVQYKEQVALEQARVAGDAGELVSVLEAAQGYLHSHPSVSFCPLCGSGEMVVGLADRVEDRLAGLRALADALRNLVQSEQKLTTFNAQYARRTDSLVTAAQNLAQAVLRLRVDARSQDAVAPFASLAQAVLDTNKDGQGRFTAAVELAGATQELTDQLQLLAAKYNRELGFFHTLRHAVATYDSNAAIQKELDLLLPRLQSALQVMMEARRDFVDAVLDRIAARVGEMYEAIHPNEGLSKVSLLLDPDKRASLEIAVPFPSAVNAPPGAYFSESHLDTLGLCIWLALAELGDAAHTILVLDDVIASVDDQHADRTIELLYDVAQNFQFCIYTTHYRPWREKYRWGWLQNGQCQFIELLPWEHARGIRDTKCLPPIDELRCLLTTNPLSVQLCCASAGVILEAMLDFLTELYECSIPRRRGKPTIGDLLPSVKGKLRSTLAVERLETDAAGAAVYTRYELQAVLNELQSLAQTRNIFGCHFNDLAQVLPVSDGIRFARLVLELADLMIDPAGGWPKSNKSGMYWSNARQTRRLYPLQQPT